MSLAVFLAVLAAAVVHAGWNALVKAADDKAQATRWVAIGAGLVAACALPWVGSTSTAALPWLFASVLLQVAYFPLLARTYRSVDLAVAYPLMRGLAPLLVVAATSLHGEGPGIRAGLGVAAISLGLGLLVVGARIDRAGLALATANACVIAAYTVLDGHGVRLSGAPMAYAAWEAVLTALPFLARELSGALGKRTVVPRAAVVWGLVGGLATTFSYAVALWAMTRAPIAVVASLRETSIVFALIIGRVVFHETIGMRGAVAASVVVLGVIVLRTA